MSSQRPGRRRRIEGGDDEGRGLPMVPIFAGVIVAGLGIGALLSAFLARQGAAPGPSAVPLVVTHTPTPIEHTVAAAPALSAPPSIAGAVSPQAAPTTAPASLAPTSGPTLAAGAKPTEAATVKPAATAKVTAIETARPTPPVSPSFAVAAPRAPAARPVAVVTLRPVETATPGTGAPSAPPRLAPTTMAPTANPALTGAESLVRRYLEAVAHGQQSVAAAALANGSGGGLSEESYLDPTLRITSIISSRTPSGASKVEVEMSTARGQYFSTFTVQDTGHGSLITDHTIIPVGGTSAK